jgi:5'-nucleotidase
MKNSKLYQLLRLRQVGVTPSTFEEDYSSSHFFSLLLFSFFLFLFSFLLTPFTLIAQSAPIVILHTNDTHSRLESYNDPKEGNAAGVVRRHTYIQETRSRYPTIVVDAGDFSQGTPYFNLFKGFPEIELMNKMGYDVVALGNHEFDNGSKALSKRLKLAKFKIVCANYQFKNKKLSKIVKPYTIIEVEGKKIGFLGLLCNMEKILMPDYYQEVTFFDPITAAKKVVDILINKERCDIIVCLSHLGIDVEFQGDITDREIATQVSGIDFIIGGHTHLLLKNPEIINGTKIVQAGQNGVFVGKIVISD